MIKLLLKMSLIATVCLFSGVALAGSAATITVDSQVNDLIAQAPDINPKALKLGLEAYNKARMEGYDSQQLLTIVDYSKPSTEDRFWVFDLKNNTVKYEALVAHGQNSGDNYTTSFSNDPRSLKSSLGLYVTEQPYEGHNGYSLRLQGLDKGFNDMAKARDIVVHGGAYVSKEFAAAHGRLGRSWGCFALNPKVASSVINTIKDGTLIFAYYPDHKYLSESSWIPHTSSFWF